MKKLVSIAIAALAGQLIADTITWTGGAGTYGWGNAGNWDLNRVPGETDDVVIDGNITVSRGGNNLVISSLTLRNGASVEDVNELKSEGGAISPVYTGGKVSCSLVALLTGPVTISDAEITNSGTAHTAGFYRANGYLNFVNGAEGAAKYTFQSSLSTNPYTTFFSGATPLIRYNGATIDEATYNSKFQATDNGDGTTTLSFKVQEGWDVGTVAVNSVADGQAAVSFTVTKYSGGTATVSIGCATSDLCDDINSWVGSLTQLATGVSATTSYNETVPLENGVNYIRVFVTYDDKTTASFAAVARSIAYGDYGELTGVYEFIGDDNNLSKATNWALDKVPLVSGDTAPTAGTDIRWFGSAPYTTSSRPRFYSSDYFVGATIYVNGDCDTAQSLTLSNSTFTTSLLVLDGTSASQTITLYGSDFVSYRSDAGDYGFWQYGKLDKVNFISGAASTWTCRTNGNNTKEKIYTALFDAEKFTLDGARVDENTWNSNFSIEEVSVNGTAGFVKITYDPIVAINRIDEVSASSTSTSATLTATIGAQEDGTLVKFAYGTTAPTDADVLAGSAMTVSDGTATGSVSGLTDLTVYHFVVAIVDAESTEIIASKSGQFVASDFDYVYMNGAWINGFAAKLDKNASAQGGPDSALIIGTLSNTGVEVCPSRKKLKDAVLSANTIVLGESESSPTASMELCNSVYINNKTGDLAVTAPYGIYECPRPFNFTSASGNSVIHQGDAYVCYATLDQCVAIYSGLFENHKIRLDGQAVSEEMFRSSFTTNVVDTDKSIVINEESVPLKQLTITYWEPFPASARDADWTVQTGARVKLTKNTRIGALDIPDATDVKIDLNGYKLTVSSLTIAGEKKKGEFTAATLSGILTGEGKLAVGGSGFAVYVR